MPTLDGPRRHARHALVAVASLALAAPALAADCRAGPAWPVDAAGGAADAAAPIETLDFSLEAWVYRARFPERRAHTIAFPPRAGVRRASLDLGMGGRARFRIDTATDALVLTLEQPFRPGRWHHLVGVREGGSMRLYVDGALARSRFAPRLGRAALRPAAGDAAGDAEPSDDARLHRRALDPAAVRRLYQRASPLAPRRPRAARAVRSPTSPGSPTSSPSSAAAAITLLAADWDEGVLYDVDLATGALDNPRPTLTRVPVGLSFAPDGVLYMAIAGGPDNLYTVDPDTGAATLVGPSGSALMLEGDIDFEPATGRLLGMWALVGAFDAPGLVEYDTATGEAIVLSTMIDVLDPSSLAFDAAGNAWMFERGRDTLHTVDFATGAILSSVPLLEPLYAVVNGMDFHPETGELYLATGFPEPGKPVRPPALYRIDTTTGAVTEIGPFGGVSISALEFVVAP